MQLDNEIWKDINNYINRYEISNEGRIRRTKDNKILKQKYNGDYLTIGLINENKIRKYYQIHRLVAENFIINEKPDEYNIVDHIDSNKMNNKANNLRWTDHEGNMKNYNENFREYIGTPILQSDLNGKIIKEWNNIKEILNENPTYKYSYIMSRIINGKICYGYIWKYNKEDEIVLEADEVFKDIGIINGYNFSNYKISNHGKIKNIKRDTFIAQSIIKGYRYVNLSDIITNDRITLEVHRIVAMLFVPGRTKQKDIVNHLDKNRQNSYYKNLEWTTIKGNTIHAIGRKVQQIDLETGEVINTFDTITDAYQSFGKPCNSHISLCCKGKINQTLGYKWRYVDN